MADAEGNAWVAGMDNPEKLTDYVDAESRDVDLLNVADDYQLRDLIRQNYRCGEYERSNSLFQ